MDVPDLNSIKPDKKIALLDETAINYHPLTFQDINYTSNEIILKEITYNNNNNSSSLSSSRATTTTIKNDSNNENNDYNIYIFENVLNSNECNNLKQILKNEKNLTFWNSLGRENESARLFRDADTIEVISNEIAELIWNRIKDISPLNKIIINENDEENELYERELPGCWEPVGLNQNFLFAVYPLGGHFAPHTDGREIHNFNRRSFYTVIIYLNEIPLNLGGGTRFFKKEVLSALQRSPTGQWTCPPELLSTYLISEVPSTQGSLVIFDQRLVHEGVVSLSEEHQKFIIRSDIMYERNPKVVFTEHDEEAYKLFRKGEELAEAGNVTESIQLFKKACKLSPQLAAMMGH